MGVGGLVILAGVAAQVTLTVRNSNLAPADPGTTGRLHSAQVVSGMCIESLGKSAGTVNVVPCEQSHAAEVVSAYAFTADEWPGDDAAATRSARLLRGAAGARRRRLRRPRHERDWVAWVPSQGTWQHGDRKGLCIVTSETPWTGKAMDSAGSHDHLITRGVAAWPRALSASIASRVPCCASHCSTDSGVSGLRAIAGRNSGLLIAMCASSFGVTEGLDTRERADPSPPLAGSSEHDRGLRRGSEGPLSIGARNGGRVLWLAGHTSGGDGVLDQHSDDEQRENWQYPHQWWIVHCLHPREREGRAMNTTAAAPKATNDMMLNATSEVRPASTMPTKSTPANKTLSDSTVQSIPNLRYLVTDLPPAAARHCTGCAPRA